MNEVTKFMSAHLDMGSAFREFTAPYSSLAEVWENCPRSDWMLWILYKRNYRNAEKLERYIDWLREQVDEGSEEETAQVRRQHFDFHKGYAKELEEPVKAGK